MATRLTVQNIGLNYMEVEMGRVKDWLIEMEENAIDMTREEWIMNYGVDYVKIYEEVNDAKSDSEGAGGSTEERS